MGVEIRVRVELWFVSAGMSGLALGLKFGLDIILKLGLGFKFKDVYGVLQSIRMHQSKSRVIFYLGGGAYFLKGWVMRISGGRPHRSQFSLSNPS